MWKKIHPSQPFHSYHFYNPVVYYNVLLIAPTSYPCTTLRNILGINFRRYLKDKLIKLTKIFIWLGDEIDIRQLQQIIISCARTSFFFVTYK